MADIEINLEGNDPKELLRSGHHALIMKDYSNAAAALGKATQLMAQEHGDEHDSLGEIYLFYARSLLELSREEAGPLGDAIPQCDSDDDSSEEDTVAESGNQDESTDNKTEDDKKEAEESTNPVDKSKENETENTEINTNDSASTCTEQNCKTNGSADTAETSEENVDKEEPSDLQLAWEVLEVAKKIFTDRGDSGKELLSQTLILLGEVGMESENFADAVKDIQAGLEIQENLYEKTSRKLAETQYKLGIAYSTISNIEDAVKYFEKSILTLNERIQLLKEKDDNSANKEIADMEELIPEIKEKINDVKSIKEQAVEALVKCMSKSEDTEACAATSSTKDVKDISHLVKRKRKTEDKPEENQDQIAKKPSL